MVERPLVQFNDDVNLLGINLTTFKFIHSTGESDDAPEDHGIIFDGDFVKRLSQQKLDITGLQRPQLTHQLVLFTRAFMASVSASLTAFPMMCSVVLKPGKECSSSAADCENDVANISYIACSRTSC